MKAFAYIVLISTTIIQSSLIYLNNANAKGLSRNAKQELVAVGINKYLGKFSPISSHPHLDDWVQHNFDPQEGEGPICIAGEPYSVFTRKRNPRKLMIYLQGGGACWNGVAQCTVSATAQAPTSSQRGIFASQSVDGSIENDFDDWSVVYLPYCDGSVFAGDNTVEADPNFGARHHRGLRNLSAGIDLAFQLFPHPRKVLLAGSSAGGVGAITFSPFLARLTFGNHIDLYVLSDAGPSAGQAELASAAAAARANDWQFSKFYPQSCVDQGLCDETKQQTGIIRWGLQNDSTIRQAYYGTDGDLTNIQFSSINIPGNPPVFPLDQSGYRAILDQEYGGIQADFPRRFRRYIISGDNPTCNNFAAYTHTALQGGGTAQFGCPDIDLYFDLKSNGLPLYRWISDFVLREEYELLIRVFPWFNKFIKNEWSDTVEPFSAAVPLP